jgi:hypothetical protein
MNTTIPWIVRTRCSCGKAWADLPSSVCTFCAWSSRLGRLPDPPAVDASEALESDLRSLAAWQREIRPGYYAERRGIDWGHVGANACGMLVLLVLSALFLGALALGASLMGASL